MSGVRSSLPIPFHRYGASSRAVYVSSFAFASLLLEQLPRDLADLIRFGFLRLALILRLLVCGLALLLTLGVALTLRFGELAELLCGIA